MNIDPIVKSSIETGHAISELGILIMIAAIFLIGVVALTKFFVSSMRETMNSVLQSQSAIMEQLKTVNTQTESLQIILSKMSESTTIESLVEQTKENSYRLIKQSFSNNILDLISGANDIIKNNHIVDKERTYNKIQNVVNIAHKHRIMFLNNYKYHGTKLGDFANNKDWVNKKIEILKAYIYSDNRDSQILLRELKLAYEAFNYELNL